MLSLHRPTGEKCGLRDYGIENQLGLEKTPEEYVAKMVKIFRQVWRVLRDDGTLWLNMGDSYISGKSRYSSKPHTISGDKDRGDKHNQKPDLYYHPYLKDKDLCMMSARVVIALQADGWYLRSDIIWSKPNPMPESCTDRPTKAHEYLFLLTKKAKYYYDNNAIREPQKEFIDDDNYGRNRPAGIGTTLDSGYASKKNGFADYIRKQGTHYNPAGRNRRSVWTIATQAFSGDSSYGNCRIMSPDCPIHGYLVHSFLSQQRDEQQDAFPFGRIFGIDTSPSQVQEGDVVSIALNPSEFPFDECVAKDHSIQIHRTVNGLRRHEIFVDRFSCGTGYISKLRRSVSMFCRIHENKNVADDVLGEMGLCLSAGKTFHIVGILTFKPPPESCLCHYMGMLKKSQDHFAVFPEKLVEPCIMAGTSERGACPECGKGWVRILKPSDEYEKYLKTGKPTKKDVGDSLVYMKSTPAMTADYKTIGWQPQCDCNAGDPVPCLVLDPFMGSGTVALVALRAGREYIGIELNQDYIDMAMKRIEPLLKQGKLI